MKRSATDRIAAGSEDLEVGTVVWRMCGRRQDGKITWYAEPECIEEVKEHMYMFSRGGCSKNSIGIDYFLTRQDAIDRFVSKYGSLEESINPNDPLEKMSHPELRENVTEYPRTDWNDMEITKSDGVDDAGVYIGGVTELENITDSLAWRKVSVPEHGYYAECLTLREIYEQVSSSHNVSPIITVFQDSPLSGEIYQCGNYEDGKWVKHGTTKGYA